MADLVVAECCRCRNKHPANERVPGRMNKNGSTPQVCPRCGAKCYYVVFELSEQEDSRDAGDGDARS